MSALRVSLSLYAGIAILAGCGGAQSPIGGGRRDAASHRARDTKQQLNLHANLSAVMGKYGSHPKPDIGTSCATA